jgi:poly(A) polymerase
MVEPRVVPRAEHTLSRRDVDPDALKVLYRLREGQHVAYLVGGSVRDLLLGRRPKDFDIGTSAHPQQVKKLFRNCWIIGRRFRLAHVKFGQKVIEVATFRRQVQPGEEVAQDGVPVHAHGQGEPGGPIVTAETVPAISTLQDGPVRRDNTFGTPEEDAFRRDFTVNALFYDIATLSVIDYVGGLEDLRTGIIRSIGDPEVRFHEDPVRMLRAVALAARLDFAIDFEILDAIEIMGEEIAKSSPPRLLEEYYKILRAGSARKTFERLAQLGLQEPISVELHKGATEALWQSLDALDAYRAKFPSTPDTLTNAVILGCLLVPLGLAPSLGRPPLGPNGKPQFDASRLGILPLARRDLDGLRHLLAMQRRLRDLTASPHAQQGLTHRSSFRDALTWLEIHGNAPDLVEHWVTVLAQRANEEPVPPAAQPGGSGDAGGPSQRRRRRRRRRFRPAT